MKRTVFALAVAAVTLFGVTGCAAEQDVAVREPAYPIGYTPPDKRIAPPAQPPPPPAYASEPSTSPEVVVGDDEATGAEATAPAGATGADEYADTDPAALTDFRSTLDPYGSWQDDPTYGTVWVPSRTVVGEDFTPYVSAGHWVYDDDYVWVSDYSWGWAPFHYGRWAYGPGVGWEWIPGRVYAGAWVSWRYGWDDWAYVGWAPLPPLWCWHRGFAVGIGFVPYAPYAFVSSGYLFAPGVGARLVTGAAVGPIAAHTQPWAPPSAGRVAARPGVGGPPPSALHIQASSVVHATSADRGVVQAHAFARPSSAVALGARAPQGLPVTAARAPYSGGTRAPYAGGTHVPYASYSAGAGARGPAYSAGASHFGGRLGGGFTGSPSSAPPPRAAPSYSGAQPYTGSGRSYVGSGSAPASPSYSHPSAPSYHGYSGYSAGGGSTFHSGGSSAHSFGGGGFSGGGGFHSSGGGGGGFHSGGGGGGAHFGGGGGGHGGGHR